MVTIHRMSNFRVFSLMILLLALLAACNTADPTLRPQTAAPDDNLTQIPSPSSTPEPALNHTNTPPPSGLRLTPIVTPNVPTATPACPAAPPTRLIVGERGQVDDRDITPLNIRSGSSTEFRILGRLEVGEVFRVLAGPECGGEYAWYRIRSEKGLEGWIAEGVPGSYFVEPYLPG